MTIIYWGVLWPIVAYYPEKTFYPGSEHTFGRELQFRYFINHGIPLLALLIDFTFSQVVFSWRHYIIHFAVGFSYACFNLAVTLLLRGGRPIYPSHDWLVHPRTSHWLHRFNFRCLDSLLRCLLGD